MNNESFELHGLKSLLFQLSSAELLNCPAEWVSDLRSEERRHTLLMTTGRAVSLYVNDQLIPAGSEAAICLLPGTVGM